LDLYITSAVPRSSKILPEDFKKFQKTGKAIKRRSQIVKQTAQLHQSKALSESIKTLHTFTAAGQNYCKQFSQLCVLWRMVPDSVWQIINPRDLLVMATFQLVYRRTLRLMHWVISQLFQRVWKRQPKTFDESVLGFFEPKLVFFSWLLAGVYVSNGLISLLSGTSRFIVYKQVHGLAAKILYVLYSAYILNETKKYFLPIWFPTLKNDSRRNYILQKTTTFLVWAFSIIAVVDSVSSFLGVPISSTLAFGGIGGIAFGLGSRDIFSNLLGGLILLISEPFTPGDLISFKHQGNLYEGKVERVGWYQTRIRGKDTRPTYVPNSVFMSIMVTNLSRITHRRFVSQVQLRYKDLKLVSQVVQRMKQALRALPKVDLLSPFRVHFVEYGPSTLILEVSFFFATKSLDEFLFLQQTALLEMGQVIEDCEAELAFPTTTVDLPPGALTQAVFESLSTFGKPQSLIEPSTVGTHEIVKEEQ